MKEYLKHLFGLAIFNSHRALRSTARFWQNMVENHTPYASNVKIGRHTYGIKKDTIPPVPSLNLRPVVIGSFCSFAPGVIILANSEHPTNLPSTFPFRSILYPKMAGLVLTAVNNIDVLSKGAIEIGHDVWIGTNAIILSGVTIGTGAIVGAGSLVAKDVPPYAIVAGNPAKVLRFRFSDELIAKLLQSQWWCLPDTMLKQLEDYFYYTDIDEFLRQVAHAKQQIK